MLFRINSTTKSKTKTLKVNICPHLKQWTWADVEAFPMEGGLLLFLNGDTLFLMLRIGVADKHLLAVKARDLSLSFVVQRPEFLARVCDSPELRFWWSTIVGCPGGDRGIPQGHFVVALARHQLSVPGRLRGGRPK